MKKSLKFLSLLLAAITVLSATPAAEVICPEVPSAIVAQAATIKLNKKNITLVVGHSTKLKVKGTKKKAKWSSSNKKVATVKNGKVTAKKQGKAYITAKIGKKKYKCKVTVKPKPVTVRNIVANYYKASNSKGIVAILKNKNKSAVNLKLTVVFYDSNGKMVDTKYDNNYCFEAGRTCALYVYPPSVDYAKYKTSISVEDSYYAKRTYVKNINFTSSLTTEKLIIEGTNVGTKDLSTVQAAVVYYDADGNVMDYDYTYLDCNKAGNTAYNNLLLPFDKDSESYNMIKPASYKVFINHAYIY